MCYNTLSLTLHYVFPLSVVQSELKPVLPAEDGYSRSHFAHGQHGGQGRVAGRGLPQVFVYGWVCVQSGINKLRWMENESRVRLSDTNGGAGVFFLL